MMFHRTTALALAASLGLTSLAHAEIVEGTVAAVTSDWQLQIALPDGLRVAEGDSVQVLAEIPGLGPVAIATQWKVTSTQDGTATAVPNEAPSGSPQIGYLARIDTQAGAAPVAPAVSPGAPAAGQPAIAADNAPVSPEALNLYLAAQDLARSSSPSDLASAADLYRQAADMGHPGAMTALGAVYSFGRGIVRDDTAALEWQDRASRLGNAAAMFRMGMIQLTGWGVPIDMDKAAGHIRAAADNGNARAMYVLGLLYEDGDGVPRSMVEMVKWLEEAARHGHTEAMFTLGHIYLDGEDGIIPKDVYKTEDNWLAAAEAGHVGAMEELAEFYEGEATVAAKKWADAARAAPRPPEYTQDPRCLSDWECYIGDRASMQVDPVPVPSADPVEPARADRSPKVIYVVQDCDRYGASPRDPDRPDQEMQTEYADLDAQRVISECLEDINEWPDTRRFYAQIARGYHKAGMQAEAFEAAMIGAELGSSQAMGIVGIMYKTGQSVPQDANMALSWFERSGYEGNVTSMHFAAGMHLYAQGIPYNPQAAVNWFQAAADLGNARAYTNLGILYDNGEGVPYDPVRAAANLVIGLSTGSSLAKEQLLQNPNNLTGQTRVEIQDILRRDGLYSGALDGDFGPRTLQALRGRIMN